MIDAAPIVELNAVGKVYAEGTAVANTVLRGIDLRLRHGEFAALIGPSGSGKSTLLNIIGLLERASSGQYLLDGQSVADLDDAGLTRSRSRTLGFVFQFHHLLPAFTALENVTLPILIRDGVVSAQERAQALALLAQVGLSDAVGRRPGQLSGGMQQRVAIARALAAKAPLVLADEPTGNLDTRSSDDVFALLRRFNREIGTAFLVVTHDPRLAARCDRVIELTDGRVIRDESIRATA